MPYRQSLWETDITLNQMDGLKVVKSYPLGPADKWEGGEKTSEVFTYPRASGEVSLGGKASRGDGTATYLYTEPLHAMFKALDIGAGILRAVITRKPLDDEGNPWVLGGFTINGRLKSIGMPSGDYGSNDGAEIELEFALDEVLA